MKVLHRDNYISRLQVFVTQPPQCVMLCNNGYKFTIEIVCCIVVNAKC